MAVDPRQARHLLNLLHPPDRPHDRHRPQAPHRRTGVSAGDNPEELPAGTVTGAAGGDRGVVCPGSGPGPGPGVHAGSGCGAD